MSSDEFNPRHPHEPAEAVVLDAEGRCLICCRLEHDRIARQLLECEAALIFMDELNASLRAECDTLRAERDALENLVRVVAANYGAPCCAQQYHLVPVNLREPHRSLLAAVLSRRQDTPQ